MDSEKGRFIRNLIRRITGNIFIFPFIIIFYFVKLFQGKNKAFTVTGKIITGFFTALQMIMLIPEIRRPEDFDRFRGRVKKRFLLADCFYDVQVIKEDKDCIEFKALNCPVAQAFKKAGLPELAKFACASDWVIAKRNSPYYNFKRDHSHGTDGLPCSHTFIRKNNITGGSNEII